MAEGEKVETGAFMTGVGDCLFAFGVLLANKGLVEREELAATFDFVVGQQERQGGAEIESRTAMARILAGLFRLSVKNGLQVIEGGKAPSSTPAPDDPDPPAAA